MHNYIVKMRHDAGTISIRTAAQDEESAIALVCKYEMAPRRSVVSVTKVAVCAKCLTEHSPTCPVTRGRAATTTIY